MGSAGAARGVALIERSVPSGRESSAGVQDAEFPVKSSSGTPALQAKYIATRSMTDSLMAGLSAEDQMVQSCPDASPLKWHQAHTTWFFETFVLRPFLADYKPFCEEFHWLFNSYYISLGEEIPEKRLRSSFSRPSLADIVAFRAHVDGEMERLLANVVDDEVSRRVVLGLSHEQQHQELALTDIKHAFFSNPLHPAYSPSVRAQERIHPLSAFEWRSFEGGVTEIGHSPNCDDPLDFSFDNETPRHRVFRSHSKSQTATRPVASTLSSCLMTAMRALSSGFLTAGRSLSARGGKHRSIGSGIVMMQPVGGSSL